MNKRLSKKQALDLIKQIMPYQLTELSKEESESILKRVKHSIPISEDLSLHCWSQEHIFDGKVYEIVGSLNNDDDIVVMLKTKR